MTSGGGGGGLAEHRKGSVPRTMSDMTGPSNSGGLGLGGLLLGLGQPEARKAFQHHMDDALASPRRISTSRGMGGPSSTTQQSSSPYLGASSSSSFIPPTHESYYSQPPSASTPRFRQSSVQPQGYGSTISTSSGAGSRSHRRNFSVHSAVNSPILQSKTQSPVGSVFRKIRKTASAVGLRLGGTQGNYDAEGEDEGREEDEEGLEEEDEAMKSNGMRVWYRLESGFFGLRRMETGDADTVVLMSL